jgi:hypothetical protein
MLQIVTRLQWLLSSQLEASSKPLRTMSEVDWRKYEARDEEIAELFKTLQASKSVAS